MAERLRAEYEYRVASETTLTGNRVPILQRKFGIPDGAPVHLKSRGDARVYRGLLAVCGVGVALTLTSLYMMAEGTMPKKERPS